MFILIIFTEISIDETNKTHQKEQKVRGSKFMLKMSTIYANTCIQTTTPLRSQCRDDGVVQHPPLHQQTFFQLLHIMDPRTVDLGKVTSLEGYPSSPPDSNLANWVATSLEG